jgi:hypothetical protein
MITQYSTVSEIRMMIYPKCHWRQPKLSEVLRDFGTHGRQISKAGVAPKARHTIAASTEIKSRKSHTEGLAWEGLEGKKGHDENKYIQMFWSVCGGFVAEVRSSKPKCRMEGLPARFFFLSRRLVSFNFFHFLYICIYFSRRLGRFSEGLIALLLLFFSM